MPGWRGLCIAHGATGEPSPHNPCQPPAGWTTVDFPKGTKREAFVQVWHLGHPEKAIMAKSELLSASFGSQKANVRSFRLSIRAKSASTIVPKSNKACSGIAKLSPAVWIMERSSTLGRSVQADPVWGQEPYLRWGRPPAVGRPAQLHLGCLGRLKTVQRNGQTTAGYLREKYFCYG